MSQGRFIQRCCRGVLLIGMAIQGVTPDLNDLASTSALHLLCPGPDDQRSLHPDDHAPDVIGELLEWSQRLEGSRVGNNLDVAGTASFPVFAVTARYPIVRSNRESTFVRLACPSLHELCRLAC